MHFGKLARTLTVLFSLTACSGPSVSPPAITAAQTITYTGAAQTVPFALISGYSGSVTIPTGTASSPNSKITITEGPASVSNGQVTSQSMRQRKPAGTIIQPSYGIPEFIQFASTETVTFSQSGIVNIAVPSGVVTDDFILVLSSDPSFPENATTTCAPTGPNNSLEQCYMQGFQSMTPGTSYTFYLGQILIGAESFSPLNITKNALSFTKVIPSSITLSETFYFGPFYESDSCAGIATIVMGSLYGPTADAFVSPVGNGTCTVSFRDFYGELGAQAGDNVQLAVTSSIGVETFHTSSFAQKAP